MPLCGFCQRQLADKRSLRRHIQTQHDKTSYFECSECGARRNRKDSLKRHIELCHNSVSSIFKCKRCSKTFDAKQHLLTHISEHNFVNENYNEHRDFECFHCSSTFSCKSTLSRHIQNFHMTQKEKTKECRIKCLKCSNVFRFTKLLNKHYVDVHGVVLDYENLEFDCVESFKQWLEKHEHETLTRFSIWYGEKKPHYSCQRLICHRSRNTRSSVEDKDRKRCLKVSGYKRLGGICPAEIQLRVREDGTCVIRYQKTHVGHNIKDPSELKQIYLTAEERKEIAAEIQSGVPIAQIVDRKKLLNSSGCDENVSRLSLITRLDVRNIAASQKLGVEKCKYVESGCDPVQAEGKVVEHQSDIIFCKGQGEEDSQFGVLHKDDYAIVILTKNQEEYLRAYAHKVICLDGTHSTNLYGFTLHTLTVLDTDCEGLPAAFLITNRNDQTVVDIFLTCVQNRVGILEPRTLITDLQMSYYYSWSKIMGVPQYFLFCTWHVQEAWKENFNKIANLKKREDTKRELQRLLHELDPIKFENDLNSFLCEEDEDLTAFQHFFREHYVDQVRQWAYCFRTKAGINANMNLDSFHRKLKHNVTRGQKFQTVTQCLAFIFDHLTLLQTNIIEKNIRGKLTTKLRVLRKRHKTAATQYEQNGTSRIVVIDNSTYIVQSFEETDRIYTISKNELKECDRGNDDKSKTCRLICDYCKICHHAFSCTCEDSSISSNMCEHIHLIGLYLKDQQPELNEAEFKFEHYEMDVPISYMTDDGVSVSCSVNIENQALEDIFNLETVSNTSKTDKLIRQLSENWRYIEKRLRGLSENKLQRVCQKMEQVVFEMNKT